MLGLGSQFTVLLGVCPAEGPLGAESGVAVDSVVGCLPAEGPLGARSGVVVDSVNGRLSCRRAARC